MNINLSSQVFAAMLTHDMKESNGGKIEITDAEPETVEMFLGYLYESELPPLNVEQASNLILMADKYNVRALVTACQDYLLKNLKNDNLVQVLILGYLCKQDGLKDAAISMMCKNVGPLDELKDWSKLRGYPELLFECLPRVQRGSRNRDA